MKTVKVDLGEGLVNAVSVPIERVHGALDRAMDRKEARRLMFVKRRRAWLWRPMLAVGAALLAIEIPASVPVPALVFLGIGLCLPWVVDV